MKNVAEITGVLGNAGATHASYEFRRSFKRISVDLDVLARAGYIVNLYTHPSFTRVVYVDGGRLLECCVEDVGVGAYIGDSAIYFALRGARKVIVIEPHPGAYEEMLENIRLNSLETTIFPINAGLASRPGKILLEEVDIETTNVTYHRPNDQKGTIPVVTLGDLIREFNLGGAV